MRIRLGIVVRGNIQNVDLSDASDRDYEDATSVIADRLNGDADEAKELLSRISQDKGWGADPDERQYPSGDKYLIVTSSMGGGMEADEAKDKLSSFGVDV